MASPWTVVLCWSLMLQMGRAMWFKRHAMFFLIFFLLAQEGTAIFFELPKDFIKAAILPSDPYILESDRMFSLNCTLKDSYSAGPEKRLLNSSNMYFQYKDKILKGEYIINNRTIGIDVTNITDSMSGSYHCFINESSIGKGQNSLVASFVEIGNPPEPVKEIRCVSYNWNDMTCNWCPKVQPPRLTKYRLMYQIDPNGEAAECPKKEYDDCKYGGCYWSSSKFKRGQVYHLQFNISSSFIQYKTNNSKFFLQNLIVRADWSIVKPGPVTNLVIEAINSTSLLVKWEPDREMKAVDSYSRLNYTVHYTSEWGDEDVYIGNNHEKNITLTGLRPFTEYTIAVRCKTNMSEHIKMYLSEWSTSKQRTLAHAAAKGPNIAAVRWSDDCLKSEQSTPTQGSSNCKLQLYMKEIPPIDRNGPLIEYKLTVSAENGEPRTRILGNVNFYTTNTIDIDDIKKDYTISISAFTSSEEYESPPTTVKIKKYTSKIPVPTYVLAETYANESGIHFSWSQDGLQPDNFTFFKCKVRSNDATLCKTSPETIVLAGNLRNYNLKGYDPEYVYAIAANLGDLTSGMTEWIAICRHNEVPGKPEFTLSTEGEHRLVVTWNSVKCERELSLGVPMSYSLYWTDKQVPKNTSVIANRTNSTYNYVIPDLDAYTVYVITMEAVSKFGEPGSSVKHTHRTQESAPSDSPQDVKVIDVQASNITVKFKPPHEPNGNLTTMVYIVTATGGTNNKTVEISGGKTSETVTVTGLDGYTNYTLSAIARNSAGESPVSELVIEQTLTKAPSRVTDVRLKRIDNKSVLISWRPPVPQNGKITKYIISSSIGDNLVEQIAKPTDTESILGIEDCNSLGTDPKTVFVTIHAVTVNEANEELAGPPSKGTTIDVCLNPDIRLIIGIVSGCIGFLIIITGICYARCKCKERDKKDPGVNTDGIMNNYKPNHHDSSEANEDDALLNIEDPEIPPTEEELTIENEKADTVEYQELLSSGGSHSSNDSGIIKPDISAETNNNQVFNMRNHQFAQLETSGNSINSDNEKEPYEVYKVSDNDQQHSPVVLNNIELAWNNMQSDSCESNPQHSTTETSFNSVNELNVKSVIPPQYSDNSSGAYAPTEARHFGNTTNLELMIEGPKVSLNNSGSVTSWDATSAGVVTNVGSFSSGQPDSNNMAADNVILTKSDDTEDVGLISNAKLSSAPQTETDNNESSNVTPYSDQSSIDNYSKIKSTKNEQGDSNGTYLSSGGSDYKGGAVIKTTCAEPLTGSDIRDNAVQNSASTEPGFSSSSDSGVPNKRNRIDSYTLVKPLLSSSSSEECHDVKKQGEENIENSNENSGNYNENNSESYVGNSGFMDSSSYPSSSGDYKTTRVVPDTCENDPGQVREHAVLDSGTTVPGSSTSSAVQNSASTEPGFSSSSNSGVPNKRNRIDSYTLVNPLLSSSSSEECHDVENQGEEDIENSIENNITGRGGNNIANNDIYNGSSSENNGENYNENNSESYVGNSGYMDSSSYSGSSGDYKTARVVPDTCEDDPGQVREHAVLDSGTTVSDGNTSSGGERGFSADSGDNVQNNPSFDSLNAESSGDNIETVNSVPLDSSLLNVHHTLNPKENSVTVNFTNPVFKEYK